MRFRRRKNETPAELPWGRWLAEQQERDDYEARATMRPSLSLPPDLVARIDRVAAVSGVSRSELVTHVLEHWFTSWRPM